MIASKEIKILHFEDSKMTRELVKKSMEKKDIHVRSEGTLLNCERYLHTHLADEYTAIVCDVMLPYRSAEDVFSVLAESGKPCIFYTSLDAKMFWGRVKKVLKKVPPNFRWIGKASDNDLTQLQRQVLSYV
jgi:CheY-like chemotaxis protein